MSINEIILVPVEEVHILNPRVRNQVIAEEIRRNIRAVGLKRPITVTLSTDPKTGKSTTLYAARAVWKHLWMLVKQKSRLSLSTLIRKTPIL